MNELFKKALKELLTTEEIDRVIIHSKGYDKRQAKKLKKTYQVLGDKLFDIPVIVLINDVINSTNVYKDLICIMLTMYRKEEKNV